MMPKALHFAHKLAALPSHDNCERRTVKVQQNGDLLVAGTYVRDEVALADPGYPRPAVGDRWRAIFSARGPNVYVTNFATATKGFGKYPHDHEEFRVAYDAGTNTLAFAPVLGERSAMAANTWYKDDDVRAVSGTYIDYHHGSEGCSPLVPGTLVTASRAL